MLLADMTESERMAEHMSHVNVVLVDGRVVRIDGVY